MKRVFLLWLFFLSSLKAESKLWGKNKEEVKKEEVKDLKKNVTPVAKAIDNDRVDMNDILDIVKVVNTVQTLYEGKISKKALLDGATHGLISALKDPYSNFLSKEEYQNIVTVHLNSYLDGGIGIMMVKFKTSGAILVANILEDTPAEKSGLKKGDMITHVEGKELFGLDGDECSKLVKGKDGTKVKLTVKRREEKPFDILIPRGKIEIKHVKSKMLDEEIGYISIQKFAVGIGAKVREALTDLKSKGAKSIVMDLRDNPGGTLGDAIEVASVFIDKSPIVGQKLGSIEASALLADKVLSGIAKVVDEKSQTFDSLGNSDTTTPLVLLINGGSASASEVVAAAMKDHKRALLIGERTYGKGTVQTVFPVNAANPEKGYFKLTIAKFFSPNGHFIHEVGVEPHIYVGNDSSGVKFTLDKELDALRGKEEFYVAILGKVDEQKEIQLKTAVTLIKAMKSEFKEFLNHGS